MITEMKKYTFLVFHNDYSTFLSELRELGIVHVTERNVDVASDDQLQKTIVSRAEIKRILQQGATDELLHEQDTIKADIAAIDKEIAQAAVWGEFSHSQVDNIKSAGYDLRYYTCPKDCFKEEWGVLINIIGSTAYFAALTTAAESAITLPDNVTEVMVPASSNELQERKNILTAKLADVQARIDAWQKGNMDALRANLADLDEQIDWKHVILNTESKADGSLSILEGFCPIDKCNVLDQRLAEMKVALYYESEIPSVDDATPIKLHNNRFTKLFECLTGMYGWPVYGEFDPTPILAPFFLLFFALCIGDAGYGLLLILFGYLTTKGKIKIEMFDGLGPIITVLGIGSLIVGFFMGGFFGVNMNNAEWMPEGIRAIMFNNLLGTNGKIAGYDVMMVLALGVGVFHICLAMVIKALCYSKRFGFRSQLATWGWLLLILGSLLTLVLSLANIFSAEIANIVLICIAIVSALGILVFNTPGRNPMINIGAGLWDTYQMATGILGDVLSYIRLFALGLAGGMLGMAFNQLGLMVLGDTPNVLTWIGFLLIVTFGHLLNLLMACLGAFVHPLRLTFVEYFKNSGYEGKGQLYTPFQRTTIK